MKRYELHRSPRRLVAKLTKIGNSPLAVRIVQVAARNSQNLDNLSVLIFQLVDAHEYQRLLMSTPVSMNGEVDEGGTFASQAFLPNQGRCFYGTFGGQQRMTLSPGKTANAEVVRFIGEYRRLCRQAAKRSIERTG